MHAPCAPARCGAEKSEANSKLSNITQAHAIQCGQQCRAVRMQTASTEPSQRSFSSLRASKRRGACATVPSCAPSHVVTPLLGERGSPASLPRAGPSHLSSAGRIGKLQNKAPYRRGPVNLSAAVASRAVFALTPVHEPSHDIVAAPHAPDAVAACPHGSSHRCRGRPRLLRR